MAPKLASQGLRNDGCETVSGHARQVQHFVNLHVQISWQAQHRVHLHVQISWQAQYKMRCGEIANARNAVFFNGTDGSEAGKSRFAERRVRDGLGSCSDHGRNRPSIGIRVFTCFLKCRFRGRCSMCRFRGRCSTLCTSMCRFPGRHSTLGTSMCRFRGKCSTL